jgi:hypothetical protein
VGYSLPRVYPAGKAHKPNKSQAHLSNDHSQKASYICNAKNQTKGALKSMQVTAHQSRNLRHSQSKPWKTLVFPSPSGPLPDSEFSTGPCAAYGIGVPALRARTRASKVLTEFWCASWLTCCPGFCIIPGHKVFCGAQQLRAGTWHSTWTTRQMRSNVMCAAIKFYKHDFTYSSVIYHIYSINVY